MQWALRPVDMRILSEAARMQAVEWRYAMTSATEKAVIQLKAYGRYIYNHAENIVGDIDKPNYVTEGGIRISFTLLEHDRILKLDVSKEHIVIDALEGLR